MFTVIPYIYKEKLGRDSHFVLKYSALESYFLGRAEKNIYLEVWFHARQVYWKSERDYLQREGEYKLLAITHTPWQAGCSWLPRWLALEEDDRNPILVRCLIYALPNVLSHDAKLERRTLREVVKAEINKVAALDTFKHRWQVTAWLHQRNRVLKCISVAWEGMKIATVSKQNIDLSHDSKTSI